MKVPALLKNKYVLYVLLMVALINVLGYIALEDYNSLHKINIEKYCRKMQKVAEILQKIAERLQDKCRRLQKDCRNNAQKQDINGNMAILSTV